MCRIIPYGLKNQKKFLKQQSFNFKVFTFDRQTTQTLWLLALIIYQKGSRGNYVKIERQMMNENKKKLQKKIQMIKKEFFKMYLFIVHNT